MTDLRSAKTWHVRDIPAADPWDAYEPAVQRLLLQRDVRTPDQAAAFLEPRLDQMHDPLLLKGCAELVRILVESRDQVIGIHGDYDVDGMTSTALYTRVLRRLGYRVVPFVPHRMLDHYGVAERGLASLAAAGVTVLLTCDTGFSAAPEVAHAVDTLGMRVLLTDHHLPPDVLPRAHALVNPVQEGCPYPWKGLCGAGVAFKVCQALCSALGADPRKVLYPDLDLVAIGTICDVMSLRGENRALVTFGLKMARQTRNVGLKALIEVSQIRQDVLSSRDVGWKLGPRLNAAGRVDDAALGLELLLEEDPVQARLLAQRIDALNVERQALSGQVVDEALAQVGEVGPTQWGLVAADAGQSEPWHPGVIGIAAGRVMERYGRPTFVFARDPESGCWKGSGRSPASSGVHLRDALVAVAETSGILQKYGGHAAAAGATLVDGRPETVAAFAQAFNVAAGAQVHGRELGPELGIDVAIALPEAADALCDLAQRLEPTGRDNPLPTLGVMGATLVKVERLNKKGTAEPAHYRLTLEDGGVRRVALWWNAVERVPDLERWEGALVDVAGTLERSEFRGTQTLQLIVADVRSAQVTRVRR